MTLKEIYETEKAKPNPAQVFVDEVAEVTCRERATVRQWLSGTQTPNQKAKERLAKHFGKSVSELFGDGKNEAGKKRAKKDKKKGQADKNHDKDSDGKGADEDGTTTNKE